MEVLALSINNTARTLGLGRTKVYDLINSGDLEAIKIGRRTLVKTASIRSLANGGA